jgi:hypothetical protein
VTVGRALLNSLELQRVNDVMAAELRHWSVHEMLDLIAHNAAAAKPAGGGERSAELGKSVAGWAQKATEVLLVERLFGGTLSAGLQTGIDGIIALPNGLSVDCNVKLVTKYSLQDNFKNEDIAKIQQVRQERGDPPQAPPPFGRLALVLHPHPPRSAKNGLYFMPDYSKGVYGSQAKTPMLQPVRLATLTELEAAKSPGKLKQFRQVLISRLQSSVDWKRLQKHMVQSEANNNLGNMKAMGAVIRSQRALAGKKAAEIAAQAGVSSLEQTEEGKKAILASETHRQSLQEAERQKQEAERQKQEAERQKQEAERQKQEAERREQLYARLVGLALNNKPEAVAQVQEHLDAGRWDEAEALLKKHGR